MDVIESICNVPPRSKPPFPIGFSFMIRFSPTFLVISGALALFACGGGQPPKVAVCKLPPPEGVEIDPEVVKPPSTEELVTLVLGERAKLGDEAPANECTGKPIEAPTDDCDGEKAPLSPTPVGPEEIVTRSISFTETLVWIITKTDGVEGEGPVALVERDLEEGLAVRAIGTLRTKRTRPRLKMSDDRKLLIIDSDECGDPDDITTCERSARLLVLRGTRFVPAAVKHPKTLECIAGSTIELSRTLERELPSGWTRSFQLAASWEAKNDSLYINEMVTIVDSDPENPSVPPRPFREVTAKRRVKIGEDRVVSAEEPLLDRAVVQFGSAHTEAPSAKP